MTNLTIKCGKIEISNMSHPFFTYHGPISIDEISKLLNIKIEVSSTFEITDIKDLSNSDQNSLTFLHSNRYRAVSYTHLTLPTKA